MGTLILLFTLAIVLELYIFIEEKGKKSNLVKLINHKYVS